MSVTRLATMPRTRSYLLLPVFILIVAGIAMSGGHFQPGAWYAGLTKPFWTPPDWLFPPVWGVLYLMIAVAGWLIFIGSETWMKILWCVQLMLNGLWSWLFFGLHQTALGLIDMVALLISIAALFALALPRQRAVAWLTGPYLAWVAYALSLNAAIYVLNVA
jgi:translocator protein